MKTFEEAKKSLDRVTFTEAQRARSQHVWHEAEKLLKTFWENASPSPELTLASRSLEEALMWHSKAISSELK